MKPNENHSSPLFPTVLLSKVSINHSHPQSENMKWKISEINHS